MLGFQAIERHNADMATDMVEDAVAGRAFAPGSPIKVAATVRALSKEQGKSTASIVAAAATALQENWTATYTSDDVALRMASLVELQSVATERLKIERGQDVSAEAAGRFSDLPSDRQEAIASDINRGSVLTSSRSVAIAEAAQHEMKAEAKYSRGIGRTRDETMRRDLDRARLQLSIGAGEWRDAGERGRVAMLLHVQVPAMIRAAGGDVRIEPSNETAVGHEEKRIQDGSSLVVDGPRGVKENIRLARQLSNWLAPMLDNEVRNMTQPGGSIDKLAERTKAAFARPIERQIAARGVGIAA